MKFHGLYAHFKQEQQGLTASRRADVRLMHRTYHRAVEDWLSRIQAQRLAKETGSKMSNGGVKRKANTVLEDESDEEFVRPLLEGPDQNPRKMAFDPPIIAPSNKCAKLSTNLPYENQTAASMYEHLNDNLAAQHKVSSGQIPSKDNRRLFPVPNLQKRTSEDSEDIGTGYAYARLLHPSSHTKRQKLEQASSNSRGSSSTDGEIVLAPY